MIRAEERKLQLIESLLKETDEVILKEIEKILHISSKKHHNALGGFNNRLSNEELDAFEKNIQEGCEQITDDDWK